MRDSPPSAIEARLLALCSIPSPTGEESALCDYIEHELRQSQSDHSVARDGHSLVVTVPAREGLPSVVLAGHLDTVRTHHDGPPRIDGERLYGPGAADMKSGLAVMLELLRSLREGRTPKYAITFVFYEKEEGPYEENRLGELLDRFASLRRADLAVCLEPSENQLQLGCMGSVHARVIFHGKTSHSARPWQGENAIHKSSGFLGRLSRRGVVDHTLDGMLYREVISATMAEGGRGRNVVPDRFTLNVNHRFAPGKTPDDAVRELTELVDGEAEIEVFDRSPSALPARHHPMVEALISTGVTSIAPKQAWTDVARFASLGVAAVNFGPGTQSQAHQRNEYTDRAALAHGLTLFHRWLFTD